jgi:hypothetical protein
MPVEVGYIIASNIIFSKAWSYSGSVPQHLKSILSSDYSFINSYLKIKYKISMSDVYDLPSFEADERDLSKYFRHNRRMSIEILSTSRRVRIKQSAYTSWTEFSQDYLRTGRRPGTSLH